jgi:hypothetical protein
MEVLMGMHLVNKQQNEYGFSVMSWYKVLNLAFMCGWIPAGTLPPADYDDDEAGDTEYREWDGRYHSGEGQWITREDALAFAAALEAGLDDIPDLDLGEPIRKPIRFGEFDMYLNEEETIERVATRYTKNPFEYFSGPQRKTRLRDFIAFCRQGGFMVW